MIKFHINGIEKSYTGDENINLLKYLREVEGITSLKDGCAPQAACGACTVEIDGNTLLACVMPMKRMDNTKVITLEGVPEKIRKTIAKAFIVKGAVHCGFCSPGFIMRTKVILEGNPAPSSDNIKRLLTPNLCRCTGYK